MISPSSSMSSSNQNATALHTDGDAPPSETFSVPPPSSPPRAPPSSISISTSIASSSGASVSAATASKSKEKIGNARAQTAPPIRAALQVHALVIGAPAPTVRLRDVQANGLERSLGVSSEAFFPSSGEDDEIEASARLLIGIFTSTSPTLCSISCANIRARLGTSVAPGLKSLAFAAARTCRTPSPMSPLSNTSNTIASALRVISTSWPSGLSPSGLARGFAREDLPHVAAHELDRRAVPVHARALLPRVRHVRLALDRDHASAPARTAIIDKMPDPAPASSTTGPGVFIDFPRSRVRSLPPPIASFSTARRPF